MQELTAGIAARVRGQDVFYTLAWSPLIKADKYKVTTSVPAVAGVYELYMMDEERRLNLLTVAHAWYGGLRSQLREAIDPDAAPSPLRRAAIAGGDLYCRYAPSDSLDALLDVAWFLRKAYFANAAPARNSGKYASIHLEERAPDRVHWVEQRS